MQAKFSLKIKVENRKDVNYCFHFSITSEKASRVKAATMSNFVEVVEGYPWGINTVSPLNFS
jgi:hypothetical protein